MLRAKGLEFRDSGLGFRDLDLGLLGFRKIGVPYFGRPTQKDSSAHVWEIIRFGCSRDWSF